jgi:hypothetical protein
MVGSGTMSPAVRAGFPISSFFDISAVWAHACPANKSIASVKILTFISLIPFKIVKSPVIRALFGFTKHPFPSGCSNQCFLIRPKQGRILHREANDWNEIPI